MFYIKKKKKRSTVILFCCFDDYFITKKIYKKALTFRLLFVFLKLGNNAWGFEFILILHRGVHFLSNISPWAISGTFVFDTDYITLNIRTSPSVWYLQFKKTKRSVILFIDYHDVRQCSTKYFKGRRYQLPCI